MNDDMTNLLEETTAVLSSSKKVTSDVLWVGSKDGKFAISWDDFKKIANIEYDRGYGGAEIMSDLVVVGDNWWLERGEYDGSEWWDFHTLPIKQLNPRSFTEIKKENYEYSLGELNDKKPNN